VLSFNVLQRFIVYRSSLHKNIQDKSETHEEAIEYLF